MGKEILNYYGNLCTEMYELLHPTAPTDELNFYLSYVENKKEFKILEPLCGSGRFLIPFMEKGYDIKGMDLSKEMLDKLLLKRKNANVCCCSIEEYKTEEKFDYIFISSGSMSLFTDINICKEVLSKIKNLLSLNGKFVFAVDTTKTANVNNDTYNENISVITKEGYCIKLKSKDYYDEKNQIQYSPSIYELYNGENLLKSETMNFQLKLYNLGEMEEILKSIGFNNVLTYCNFNKDIAKDNNNEILLYECW